jgi:transposase-like protein
VRLNKEITRCTIVAGVFPDPAALPRLAGARLARADFPGRQCSA